VDEAGAGRGVAGSGDPGQEEEGAVGPGEGEEAPELREVPADLGDGAGQAMVEDGRLLWTAAPRPGRDGGGGGQRDDVISLLG